MKARIVAWAAGVASSAMLGAAVTRGRFAVAAALAGALAASIAIAARATSGAHRAGDEALHRLSSLVEQRSAELDQRTRELVGKMRELEAVRTHLGVTERLASVGRLAAGIAHEINSPLAVVLTNVEWLRETLPHGDQGRALQASPASEVLAALEETERAGQSMAHIIRDLANFARDGADARGANDLVTVLQHVQRLVAHEVRARARLSLELPDAPVLVRGSSASLAQLFAHLLLHAAQATEEGHPEENEVRVVARAEDGGAAVIVTDTGKGLDADALAHVFDPFYAAWSGDGANGLGLGVCHGIACSLGGEIRVENAPGHGSVYRVRLAGPDSASRLALGPRGTSRPRVLVIDDEPLVCASLYRVLSRDFDVVPLTSAAHALSLLRAGERFDAVLCDLMMPEMGGLAFHQELARLRPQLADALIFLSGAGFTNGEADSTQRLSNACLPKPFDPAALIALVAERCRVATASRAA